MPDLLLICRDDQSCFELEALARDKSFRYKSTFELQAAEDWLRLRPFDVLFMDAGFSLQQQEKLAGLLWNANPMALFVVFDLDPNAHFSGREARLFGAEVARGRDALKTMRSCLERVLRGELAKDRIRAENFRIMVVEDLDSPRDIICMYVESLGFPLVNGFQSAKEAMRELQTHPDDYSCVITDIRMPEVSGQHLIEFIRGDARLQHIPVIVLTAYGTVDCLIDCLKAGVTGFLVKPPKKKDLNRELSRALRIVAHKLSPRLATPEEAAQMHDLLVSRGFM